MPFCHKNLEESHAVLNRDIMNPFTVFFTVQPFTRTFCIQVNEMTIDKLGKPTEGLPRITEIKYVSQRWIRLITLW